MQYSIHEDNMQKLSEKLKRIENKCNKYGCTFSYAEIGEEYREVKHYAEIIGAYGRIEHAETGTTTERFVIVEVEGTAIINNWRFIATLEHTEHGNIIRSYATDTEIPEQYKTCSAQCDHCNSSRYRKDTYIIQNTETSEFKQVGKSCLKDYTNGLSAEAVAQYLSYFDTLVKLDRGESLGGFTRHYYSTQQIILAAYEIVSKMGFVSKQKARDDQKISTTEKILAFISENPTTETIREKEKINYNPDTESNKKAIQNILTWLQFQEPDSQYISNLQITCKNEWIEYRDIGIIASLPAAYHKAMEKESQDKKRIEESKSEFIGNIKDKITLENVSINCIARYETEYGVTKVYKILDQLGNIYVWKSANYVEDSESVNIKGTIKSHNEFRGEKQTELTRCKVTNAG